MFLTPYQTTTCRSYNIGSIVDNVRKDILVGDVIHPLIKPELMKASGRVRLLTPSAKSRQFGQILTPLELQRSEDPGFVVDARHVLSVNRSTREHEVRNPLDYNRLITHVNLINYWIDGFQNRIDLLNISPLCGRAYAAYMGNKIARMFNLDLEQELMISVVAGWFYYCSFYTEEELSEYRKTLALRYINQWTRLPAARSQPILDKLEYVNDLNDFVDALKVVIGGPSIESLDVGLLLSKISNGWFDHTGKENLVVGFEYPPTWIYMCVSALDTRSFSRSELGKLVNQLSGGGLGDQLLKNFKSINKTVEEW